MAEYPAYGADTKSVIRRGIILSYIGVEYTNIGLFIFSGLNI